MTLIVLTYHIALIAFAYWLGRDSAGKGVAAFLVGVVAFQLYVNGPSSFFDSGCETYGHAARDC